MGLVEEEDGIDLVVEEVAGAVRVVCPNAQLEVNESAAMNKKIVRMFTRSPKRFSSAVSLRYERLHSRVSSHFLDADFTLGLPFLAAGIFNDQVRLCWSAGIPRSEKNIQASLRRHLVRTDARPEFQSRVILSQIPPKPKLLSAGHEFAVNFVAEGSIGVLTGTLQGDQTRLSRNEAWAD